MALFYKLNNHANSSQGFAAYYHTQAPHNHVDWEADINNLSGQTLYLCSNKFGVKDKNFGPFGHFGIPRRGDLIIIFQRVCNVPRVVSHILEYTDDVVSTFQATFPQNRPVINAFQEWPYLRCTRVVSVLNPDLCGNVKVKNKPDLKFLGILPKGAVTFDDLGGGYTPNGRVRLNTHKFIDTRGQPYITMAKVKELIFRNPVYLHDHK